MNPRAVLDSSILLSGMVFGGKPGQVIDLARKHHARGLTCPDILREVGDKLVAKFDHTDRQANQATYELLEFLELFHPPGTLHGVCNDPKDEIILECAVVGNATHIVSGDKKHLLSMKEFQGVAIVSAAEFLEIVVEA